MDDFFLFDEDDTAKPQRVCDHPGCHEAGDFPAPKSRHNLRDYHYFCLDHVREYNKKWNFFAGFTQDQMYDQMKKDTAWERPTWPVSETIKIEEKLHDFIRKFTKGDKDQKAPSKQPISKEAKAYDALGLLPNADLKTIKTRYRELVKRYHPDKNPDNPKAVERFKVISEAYSTLTAGIQGK